MNVRNRYRYGQSFLDDVQSPLISNARKFICRSVYLDVHYHFCFKPAQKQNINSLPLQSQLVAKFNYSIDKPAYSQIR